MIEVEACRYTAEQIARWRPDTAVYIDHDRIHEPPNAVHRTRLEGTGWLPEGLPGEARYIAAANDRHALALPIAAIAVTDGRGAVFGTGAACFPWRELAVLDGDHHDLWLADLDLGMKRPDDVWIVTISPDR